MDEKLSDFSKIRPCILREYETLPVAEKSQCLILDRNLARSVVAMKSLPYTAAMIINRWVASIQPTKEQIKIMLENEGLEPFEEVYEPSVKIVEHRHPFGEVRVVVEGELVFNIAGNQILLRPGDRVEVPANTKHSHVNNGRGECLCIVANRPF